MKNTTNTLGRYSNADPETVTSTTTTTNGTGTSGSGLFANFDLNKGLDTVGSTLSNIFGNNGKYEASAYRSMYDESQSTNTVLFVALGLVLALGVFLLIRKK